MGRPSKKKPKSVLGRPPVYQPKYAKIVKEAAAEGCTVRVMAWKCDNIHHSTFYAWEQTFQDFSESLRFGRGSRLNDLEIMLRCFQTGEKVPWFDPKKGNLPAVLAELKCIFYESWSDKQKITEIVTDFVAKTGNQKLDILSICAEVKKD